jgi:hypothetical protein
VLFPPLEPGKHPLAPLEILLLARMAAGERLVLKTLPFLQVEMREFLKLPAHSSDPV